jgi:hypothetical protein
MRRIGLQMARLDASMFCHCGRHSQSDFLPTMKREDKIGYPGRDNMRGRLGVA